MTISLEALGTKWQIEILQTGLGSQVIENATTDFLQEFENRYSRFKTGSWLTQLNRDRVFHDPHPEFVELLNESLRFYAETKNIFNIAIGEKMNESGYDATYSFTSTPVQSVENTDVAEMLLVTREKITLRSGQLDLGGIGKGFAIDKLAALYQAKFHLQSFVINGGGDIYATHDDGQPIQITLTHPKNHALSIGTVELKNQGFASSSPWVRAWPDKKTGKLFNHLHTSNEVTSYVVAPTATEADVWATTLCVEPATKVPAEVASLLLAGTSVVSVSNLFDVHTKRT